MIPTVPETSESVIAVACRCKSQFCEGCAWRNMIKWRSRLDGACEHWPAVMMLTLTVDQNRYDGPEDAFRRIQKGRKVAKFICKMNELRHLRTREYTLTIEFHENGWPHYHILVPETYVDKYKMDKVWGIGHTHFSKQEKFQSVKHALNYVTKYVSKTDDEDGFSFPDWVMEYKGQIRRFSTSRGLVKAEKAKRRFEVTDRKKPEFVTPNQRVAKCCKTTKVLKVVTTFVQTGPLDDDVRSYTNHQLMGVLDKSWAECKDLPPSSIAAEIKAQIYNDGQHPVEILGDVGVMMDRDVRKRVRQVYRDERSSRTNDHPAVGCQ